MGGIPRKSGLRGRSFWAFMATQFLGAANDSAFKYVTVFLVLGRTPDDVARLVTYMAAIGAVFELPFLLFSTWAGSLADRLSKRTVIVWMKAAEALVMLGAVFALWTGIPWACLVVLFLMGTQSAFFGPAKYGILPELLEDEDLSQGNGILQMLTTVAIITGTVAGGVLFEGFQGALQYAGAVFVALALVGTATSLLVERVPAAAAERRPRWNAAAEMLGSLRLIHRDRSLFLSVLGVSFFWFAGACFQLNFPVYAGRLMSLSSSWTSALLALTAVGIGTGSLLAGRLSGRKVEFGLVPIGAAMMASLLAVLYLSSHSAAATALAALLLGVGGGFYLVPLVAFVQQRAPADRKGMVLATNNFLGSLGVLLASVFYFAVGRGLGANPAQVFGLLSLLVVGAAVYIFTLLPDFLFRFCLWVVVHSFYKVRVLHPERVPKQGGALLVCNHVSYIDQFLLLASIQRFIRFVMFRRSYEEPLFNWGSRLLNVVPIGGSDALREMVHSLRTATQAIRDGDLVGIFAEGAITRTGSMHSFKRGLELIMKRLDAPIIPVHIDRMWGSIFSFERGRAIWKWPVLSRRRVTVSYGEPLPSHTKAPQVRQVTGELGAEAFALRKPSQVLLHDAFIDCARSAPFRMAMGDSSGRVLTYGGALTKAIALADFCRRRLADEHMVGVVLPASSAGALVNVGLLLAGKTPVNLNFTVGADTFRSSLAQCGIRTVVTSRAFVEKVPLPARPEGTIYAEDLRDLIGKRHRLAAFLKAWLAPKFVLRRLYSARRRSVEDLATVIFSSGSTGEPKGIMLTHSNVMSNIDGLSQVFGLGEKDRICGVLPFFHSFGFTATLWFPLVKRVSVVYHPNPTEGRPIGGLVREFGATTLLATPTFLRIYIRSVSPWDFGSLEHVVVGAEKLSDDVAERFRQTFGVRPVEGYGCSECAPVVSVNVPDFRTRGLVQIGTKPGTIGQPLPGVAVRIVDPDTREPLPIGREGLLMVKGPNVMKGYLGRPEKTAEVLTDGWYNTGDIARLDEDGFLTITDRLSRFSKIGGEMVPHLKIEEAITRALGPAPEAEAPLVAVAGVPDEQKGERLVVLHTRLPVPVDEVWQRLTESDLPKLWVPRRDAFHEIEKMPLLGTGKLDLSALKAMATRL